MNILVIGSGGREHALAWSLASSPKTGRLFCAPGNGGMAELAECVELSDSDFNGVVDFCQTNDIELVVIGPEAPLAAGLADRLEAEKIRVFGPSAQAAQLEGSKGFTKDLCADYEIPTGRYGRFMDAEPAKAFIREFEAPYVIKADGLAAGKGVIIAESLDDADTAIDEMLSGKFGAASDEILIEEFLHGEEASFFAIVDGDNALALTTAQDHKRVGDGDTGLNTGGMGAYSPAPVMTDALCDEVMDKIIYPTMRGMKEKGMPFKGVLYAGLMITETGPQLIEYNVRFGDPECQVLMARLESDLVDVLVAACDGKLNEMALCWSDKAALTVVLAAEGYPGGYEKGTEIKNIDAAQASEDTVIFHAGTKRDGSRILATGGRVLNVTALGDNITQAQRLAYEAVDMIEWPQGFCRRDIGWRAVEREKQ